MGVRLAKPWRRIDERTLEAIPGQLGVFELADPSDSILLIGCADARSLFGLRSALKAAVRAVPGATQFRIEITTAYHTRFLELLMAHRADHGRLPAHNAEQPDLGWLSPG